jgi:hypothetical protein
MLPRVRLPANIRSLLRRQGRATRPAVPGGTRRDFFGDRLATFEELRAANDLATPREASQPPPVRHVA